MKDYYIYFMMRLTVWLCHELISERRGFFRGGGAFA